jgi:hypothetical protein
MPQAAVIPVADVGLVPLANGSIADVRGAGLSAPGFGNSLGSSGVIVLWDELKPAAHEQDVLDGMSTITVNGSPQ